MQHVSSVLLFLSRLSARHCRPDKNWKAPWREAVQEDHKILVHFSKKKGWSSCARSSQPSLFWCGRKMQPIESRRRKRKDHQKCLHEATPQKNKENPETGEPRNQPPGHMCMSPVHSTDSCEKSRKRENQVCSFAAVRL